MFVATLDALVQLGEAPGPDLERWMPEALAEYERARGSAASNAPLRHVKDPPAPSRRPGEAVSAGT